VSFWSAGGLRVITSCIMQSALTSVYALAFKLVTSVCVMRDMKVNGCCTNLQAKDRLEYPQGF
jgi:hypothetical protein